MNSKAPFRKQAVSEGKQVRLVLMGGGVIDADASSVYEDEGAIYGTTPEGMNFVLPISNMLYAMEDK